MVALGVNGSAYYITCNRLIAKDNINSFNTDGRIYFTSSDNQIWSIGCNVNKDWSLRNETLSIDSITADYNTGAVSLYGGGGAVSVLSNLEDVVATPKTDGTFLFYNSTIDEYAFSINTLKINDTSKFDVAIGYEAGRLSQGSNSIAIGHDAGGFSQGASNVAIGYRAGLSNQKEHSISIGDNAGYESQGSASIAIGDRAGSSNQSFNSVAMGLTTGFSNQGHNCVAIGTITGFEDQGDFSIAIGYEAGKFNQSNDSVAIGNSAGRLSQNLNCVAIGLYAGYESQGNHSVAIGYEAGDFSQGASNVAIGVNSGKSNQGEHSISIGVAAGCESQGNHSVAIGYEAGAFLQTIFSIALGYLAGSSNQSFNSIAMGLATGFADQGSNCVAIGTNAGFSNQANYSTAIGYEAGAFNQSNNSVAIGNSAGRLSQNFNSVAIGLYAGSASQSLNSIAIGINAGFSNQGSNCVAIGTNAGIFNQASDSIVLNAGGTFLIPDVSGTFINPIRTNTTDITNAISYSNTKEVCKSSFIYFDNSNKRIGIGIEDPDEELEIDGSIQIDSANVARLKFKKTGQNSHALSEIDGEQDGTNGGDLQFYTKIDGGSVTEKLRINNQGAIGIGGANYGTAGQVLTSDGSGNAVSWEDQTDTTYTNGTGVLINPANVISIGQSVGTGDSPSFTQMSLGNTGTNHGILNLQDITNIGTEDVAQIQGIIEGTNGGQLQFYTKADSGGVLTERLRISNDGNVRFFNNLTTDEILGTASNVAIDLNQSRGGFGSIYFDTGRAGNNFEFYVNEINSYFNGNPEGLYLNFNGGGGVFYGSPPTQLSDDRIKFNETNITNGLEVVRKLSPERYTKRLPTETVGTVEAGFIAQEVLSIPDLEFAVKQSNKEITPGDPNTNYYTVTYDSIFTYAVAGLKELDTIVQQQQTVIQNLVTRIEALESK